MNHISLYGIVFVFAVMTGCLLNKKEDSEIATKNPKNSINSGRCWGDAVASDRSATCLTLTGQTSTEALEELCLTKSKDIQLTFTANESCSLINSYGACENEENGITAIEYYYLSESSEDKALLLGIAQQLCATRKGIFHKN